MKMLPEYLERALSLERLAADEQDATFKSALLQAEAYRKLATKRTSPQVAHVLATRGGSVVECFWAKWIA
jgi:hypothetical protein